MAEHQISSVAQADMAGGSPINAGTIPYQPVSESEDVFVEASTSSRYFLYDDDEKDEACCWGLINMSSKKNSTDLQQGLLSTPPRRDSMDSSSCCKLFYKSKSIPERIFLPRLSSTLIGGVRTTPGSNRMSSPATPRGRGSSFHSHNDQPPLSLGGAAIPLRPTRRPSDATTVGRGGGNIEVIRKFVMLGARNSGKSAVVHRFTEKRFGTNYDPTIESSVRASITLRGITFLCDLLDTAGQDETSNFSRQATVGVHGYCMVFSVTSMQSFLAIQKIRDRIVDLVGSYTVPTVLVGTKSDDETRREVSSTTAESLAETWGVSYVECSAKSNYGIDAVFVTLLLEIEKDSGLLASDGSESSEYSAQNRSTCVVS